VVLKMPRELTWVTGVILSVITVSFGVTGYSLPWDQVGYWAVKIVTGVPDAIPVVGGFVVELLRGSVGVGQPTLYSFLQFTHICTSAPCSSIYAYALPYDS